MADDKMHLARIGEWETWRTGKRQTTGFSDVDNAVATMVNALFDEIMLVDPMPEEARFLSFLERPPAERVYVGRFDDAIEFIKAVRRANAGQGRYPKDNDSLNRDALPLVNISRSMDVSYVNSEHQIDRRIGDTFTEPETGMPLASLELTQALLTYDITLMATDKATIGLMSNAIGARIRLMIGTQFEAITKLVRVPVALNCAIIDAKEIGFTDVSTPIREERVYAVQAPLTINAQVITAWELDAKRRTVDIRLGVN